MLSANRLTISIWTNCNPLQTKHSFSFALTVARSGEVFSLMVSIWLTLLLLQAREFGLSSDTLGVLWYILLFNNLPSRALSNPCKFLELGAAETLGVINAWCCFIKSGIGDISLGVSVSVGGVLGAAFLQNESFQQSTNQLNVGQANQKRNSVVRILSPSTNFLVFDCMHSNRVVVYNLEIGFTAFAMTESDDTKVNYFSSFSLTGFNYKWTKKKTTSLYGCQV